MARPASLLSSSILLLLTGLALGGEQNPAAESQPTVKTPTRPLKGDFDSLAPAVKRVAPAVVRIVTALRADSLTDRDAILRSFLQQTSRGGSGRVLGSGLGSGVIMTEDGYILTNGHLVDGSKQVEVTLQDGREFNAKVIGLDSKSDVAVLKIEAQRLPTVPLAESHNVQVGDSVLAFGYPFGVGQTVTHGIVSATDRDGIGTEDYESFIQTDAPINPGNSGGALVDVTGELIGINTAILSSSGGNLGIGFAVPSDLARRVMNDLIKYGYVVRGHFGVETQDLTPALAREFKLRGTAGALVGGVVPKGPGEKAGLEIGDVITRLDGKEVRDTRQLNRLVADAKPGQVVPIQVVRDGSATTLRVTVGQASQDDLLARSDRTAYEQDSSKLQGVMIGELNNELRQQLKIPRNVTGALVFGVNPFSTAAEAGLKPGDVIESINRQEVGNAGEVSQLGQATRNKRMLLRVWGNSGSHFIVLE